MISRRFKTTLALAATNVAVFGALHLGGPSAADAQSGTYARSCKCNIVQKMCEYVDNGCVSSTSSTCLTTQCPG